MVNDIARFKEKVIGDKANRDLLRKQLNKERENTDLSIGRMEAAIEARRIFQELAQQTQKTIEDKINGLVTMALEAIFPDPYKFNLRFVQKRNKTECEIILEKHGQEMKPMDAAGGGVIDVISMICRISFWALKRKRPVLILDEPAKFVSRDLLPKVAELLKTISSKMGMQMIVITHLPELAKCADQTIEIGGED